MFSVMRQEKTTWRDVGGATVYRRHYLCDAAADISALPGGDAPGSTALVATGGAIFILDHGGHWQCSFSGGADEPEWAAVLRTAAAAAGGETEWII